ncbi:hypothetical protein [Jidongwangia harbinensis]|uniref:hypothetical protein n=1 Tax=Jidongwangia harbinensis TaxID=2878561 RepID=UPI001CDA3F3B|nr:hypothetical protein [Jidongwangia harbinensis]MCA2219489.1 hypothetical protein [Jidongwangia harbinensis]
MANVDAFVDLPDGSCWAVTILTVEEVRRLLSVWRETGEVANGSYFWGVDDVIVPESGIAVMTTAIRELVRSGDITRAGIRSEKRRAQTCPLGGGRRHRAGGDGHTCLNSRRRPAWVDGVST